MPITLLALMKEKITNDTSVTTELSIRSTDSEDQPLAKENVKAKI